MPAARMEPLSLDLHRQERHHHVHGFERHSGRDGECKCAGKESRHSQADTLCSKDCREHLCGPDQSRRIHTLDVCQLISTKDGLSSTNLEKGDEQENEEHAGGISSIVGSANVLPLQEPLSQADHSHRGKANDCRRPF